MKTFGSCEVSFELHVEAEVYALLVGIPLVESSLLLEPHLVRGTE